MCRLLWRGAHSVEYVLTWSAWRRRHQYRAQQCHYRRRGCVPHAFLYLRLLSDPTHREPSSEHLG
jgi:hypothetical protein